jgi:hypothetical protein
MVPLVEGSLSRQFPFAGVQWPSAREREDALALGMTRYWLVTDTYNVQHNVLVEGGSSKRAYFPVLRPVLLSEFAKLNQSGPSALPGFARQWGLLGYRQLLQQTPVRGDPVPWLMAHARGVWACLELLNYLQGDDAEGLSACLSSLRGDDDHSPALTVGKRHTTDTIAHRGDEPATEIAWWLVASIITPNLAGLKLAVTPTTTSVEATQEFDGLIDVIYWHLFSLVKRPGAEGKLLARCAECGALFVRTDRRQRFCPPPSAPNGVASESRCASRARARRLRHPAPITD